MRKLLLAVLVFWAWVLPASAQPLAQRVPDDAIVYVGWRGAQDPGPGYEGSNLQALASSSNLPAALSQVLDMIEQTNAQDPQVAMVTDIIRTIGSASWRRPTALYLQPVDDPDMIVRCVVLWQAEGEAGDALAGSLDRMFSQFPPDAPLTPGRTGDLVHLTIGIPAESLTAASASSLAQSERFTKAVQQADANGLLVVYANGQGLVSLVDRLVHANASPNEQEDWAKARDALGLAGVNAAVWSCGFDGKDWRTDLYIDAPAPRRGALTLLDSEPITDDELTNVPDKATWFIASRLDLGSLLDSVRQVIEAVDPEALAKFNEALLQGNEMTGIDLEADLIRSLGSAWILYTDPGATGSGMMGLCLVNPLKDAEKAHRALIALQALANAIMSQAGGQGGPPMHLRFEPIEHDGMTLHTLSVPFVAPTWSVHNGRLYVGLYPQAVMTAWDRAWGGGVSILDNKKYQAVRARLGGGDATTITYTDLPATAEGSYQSMVMFSQLGAGMLSMFGAQGLPALLPPYARIEPLLSPAGSVAWSDDDGYHSRSISPFPGSVALGPGGGTNTMTMSGPLMLGVTLPALGAARRSARQAQSMSNMRQVLLGLLVYAADHNDAFPDDLYTLVSSDCIAGPPVFLSPSSGKRSPPGFDNLPETEQALWLRQNSSYILIPTSNLNEVRDGSTRVCLFELPADASDPGQMTLGFVDGHVESRQAWGARQQIEAQTGMTLEELIERQQNDQPAAPQP